MHELDEDTSLRKKTRMLFLLNFYNHERTHDIGVGWQNDFETIDLGNREQLRNTEIWMGLRKLN